MSSEEAPKTPPITKGDIVRKRAATRRTFLGVAGAGVLAAAAGLTLSSAGAQETPEGGALDGGDEEELKTHCTDRDTGTGFDRIGEGDRCSAVDSDTGCEAD